jgi:hypothetical protein
MLPSYLTGRGCGISRPRHHAPQQHARVEGPLAPGILLVLVLVLVLRAAARGARQAADPGARWDGEERRVGRPRRVGKSKRMVSPSVRHSDDASFVAHDSFPC